MTLVEIAAALVRTTLATSAAAVIAWALLTWLRVNSPRIHRVAWLMVILQGWLLLPWTIEVESPPPTPPVISPVSRDARAERVPPALARYSNAAQPPSPRPLTPIPLTPITIAAWLLGAAALAAISLSRYLQLLRTFPLGSPPDATWQAEWQAARAAAKLRSRQYVDLRITTNLGPLLHWAPWAYYILVPRELWKTLAGPQRQAILSHELAHLRRGDLWKSLAIRALALPQWFNPFAWLAVRRFEEAAEWACDDAAAASRAGPLDFANSLLASAEFAATPLFGSAPAARGALARRIHRLVSPRFKEESKMKLLLVPTLLAAVALAQVVKVETIAAENPPCACEGDRTPTTVTPVTPSLAEQQRTFNLLAKEFEAFRKAAYVIESPDVVSLRMSHRFKRQAAMKEPFNYERPQLEFAECLSAVPHCYLVDAAGCIRILRNDAMKIAGLTLKEAQKILRQHLESRRVSPMGDAWMELEVRLAVAQFNSKVYFVIESGNSLGDHVARRPIPYPIDGKENVARALARLTSNSDRPIDSKQLAAASITLCRPASNGVGPERVFPIIWDVASQTPTPLTNHHLQPGDGLFVNFSKSAPTIEAAAEAPTVQPPPEVMISSNDLGAGITHPRP